MTEESVELLYALGQEHRIVGISGFVKRPEQARNLKKVCAFTSANIDKILSLDADLILGFSDIQKDIARDLIAAGENVFISNHRSLSETLDYISLLSRVVGEEDRGNVLLASYRHKIEKAQHFAENLQRRPKVYFEEWDEPAISGIKWVSELIELCGGIDIYAELSAGKLAKDRFVDWDETVSRNPEIIFPCWCGKSFDRDSFMKRVGIDKVDAVKSGHVFELMPEVFLQPGPALFVDGIDILIDYFKTWEQEYV